MPKNAEEYWAALAESGWLETIPRGARALCKREIARAFAKEPRQVFLVLATGA